MAQMASGFKKKAIANWLFAKGIADGCYIINGDGSVTATNDMLLTVDLGEEWLRATFTSAAGSFTIVDHKCLRTLEGCPVTVHKNFAISACPSLTSLRGAPSSVGSFSCSGTSITSFEHAPSVSAAGSFLALEVPKLTSLKGSPNTCNDYHISISSVASWEGAPTYVRRLTLTHSKIATFEGIPTVENSVTLINHLISSLKGVHQHLRFSILGTLALTVDGIKDGFLDLLRVTNLLKVTMVSASKYNEEHVTLVDIINRNLGTGRAGIITAYQELLDAGLDHYA